MRVEKSKFEVLLTSLCAIAMIAIGGLIDVLITYTNIILVVLSLYVVLMFLMK